MFIPLDIQLFIQVILWVEILVSVLCVQLEYRGGRVSKGKQSDRVLKKKKQQL